MKLTLILSALAMLGAFSVDTYFPSFPAIADHFGVTLADMQKTLSFYLLALAVMSLFHGAVSDSTGRRKVVLATLAIYTLACFASVFAPSFEWLVFFRVLQGLTAGAGFIVTQAIARDLHKGHEAQKLMAKIMMLFSLAPAIAPILGGYLHIWMGWQGAFIFLTLLGASILALSYVSLPETLPREERHAFHPLVLTENYLKVIRHPQFLFYAMCSSFCTASVFVYVTAAPDFILNILGLKETQFGWMFIPIVAGLVTGSYLSHHLAGKVPPDRLIAIAFALMGTAVAANVIYNVLFKAAIPFAVLPTGLYVLGSSMFNPLIALKALDLFPRNKGMASSVLSFTTIIVFAGISGLVAPHLEGSGLKLALATAFFLALAASCYFIAARQKPHPEIIAEEA